MPQEKGYHVMERLYQVLGHQYFVDLVGQFEQSGAFTQSNQNLSASKVKVFISLIELLKQEQPFIYPSDMHNIADQVNLGAYRRGFRGINVHINDPKIDFVPPAPKNIAMLVMSLLDNYYNIWDSMEPYEREAMFHMKLVQFQPYEDGNKRLANYITFYNLLKQDKFPYAIEKSNRDFYLSCINNNDATRLADFFKEISAEQEKIYRHTLHGRILGSLRNRNTIH